MFSFPWFDETISVRLAVALLHFVWQGALIALLVAAGGRLLKRATAQLRYAANVVAMLTMLACLPATFLSIDASYWLVASPNPSVESSRVDSSRVESRPIENGVEHVGESAARISDSPASSVLDPSSRSDLPMIGPAAAESMLSESPMSQTPAEERSIRWATLLTTCYSLGVLGMLLRLARGLWGGQQLRRSASLVTEDKLLRVIGEQARRLGMRRPPLVGWSRQVSIPVVVGVLRPLVLLPASMVSGLSTDQLHALLTHELAHIRRCDPVIHLLQRIAEAVMFFHPAIWFVSRRVTMERENAADDLVLRAGWPRPAYADALVRMAELSAAWSGRPAAGESAALAASGANPSEFKRRVMRLLEPDDPPLRLSRSGVAVVVLTASLLLLAPALVLSWTGGGDAAGQTKSDNKGDNIGDENEASKDKDKASKDKASADKASRDKASRDKASAEAVFGELVAADHWRKRTAARRKLIELGGAALPTLLNGCAHEDGDVREECILALWEAHPKDPAAIDAFIKAVDTAGDAKRASRIRYTCAFRLGHERVARGVDALERLYDRDRQLKLTAAKSLAELGRQHVLATLYDHLSSDHYMDRYQANIGIKAITGRDLNDFGDYKWGEGAAVSGGVEVRRAGRRVADIELKANRYLAIAEFHKWLQGEKPELALLLKPGEAKKRAAQENASRREAARKQDAAAKQDAAKKETQDAATRAADPFGEEKPKPIPPGSKVAVKVLDIYGQPVDRCVVFVYRALPAGAEPKKDDWNDPATRRAWRPQNDRHAHVRPEIRDAPRTGATEVVGLKKGSYKLVAMTSGGTATPIAFSDVIEVDGRKDQRVELRMQRGGGVRVEVIDAATGAPLEHASVWMEQTPATTPPGLIGVPQRGKTVSSFEHLPPGEYQFSVKRRAIFPSDLEFDQPPKLTAVEIVAGRTKTIRVPLAGRQLAAAEIARRWPYVATGKVTDAAGRPVAGATVRALDVYAESPYGRTVTDEQGRYRLRFRGLYEVPDNGQQALFHAERIQIKASNAGLVDQTLNRQGLLQCALRQPTKAESAGVDGELVLPDTPKKVDFVLVPQLVLRFQVRNGQDRPESATLMLKGRSARKGGGPQMRTTDAAGRCTFSELAAGRSMWFSIHKASGNDRTPRLLFSESGEYSVELAPRFDETTGISRMQVLRVTRADGSQWRDRVLVKESERLDPPSAATQAKGVQILKKVIAVNRHWLGLPPDEIENYSYLYRTTGGEHRMTRVLDLRKSSLVERRGIRYISAVDHIARDLDNVRFRDVKQSGDRITLQYDVDIPFQFEISMGSGGSALQTAVERGELVIDRRNHTVLESRAKRVTEQFFNYVELRSGQFVPLRIQLSTHRTELRFRIHRPGLWLFDRAFQRGQTEKAAAYNDHVNINNRLLAEEIKAREAENRVSDGDPPPDDKGRGEGAGKDGDNGAKRPDQSSRGKPAYDFRSSATFVGLEVVYTSPLRKRGAAAVSTLRRVPGG
ncbi:MAG: M56 family metallopeptidase [Pirellulaceae bacterium]|nr:M56 family metallopeptidase [Pirellulaceae bacterium]